MPSFLASINAGELGVDAVGETIADAEGIFRADFHKLGGDSMGQEKIVQGLK